MIYLDNNATTAVLPEVVEAMRPYFIDCYGNPSSRHAGGRAARRGLEDARESIAAILEAEPGEVIFTSGGTESNNLAVFGLAAGPLGHAVTSTIEHPSVAEPLARLEALGWRVDRLPVDRRGIIDPAELERRLSPETRLVSVMWVNNETGAIQPIAALARIAGRGPIPIHTDAVQAVGKIAVSFRGSGVAALSAAAHKFHGPKGIGVLLVRRGTRLAAQLLGGHQQAGNRPGTEPVALAVGMARALEIWRDQADGRARRLAALGRRLVASLRRRLGDSAVVLNGPELDRRAPHTLNLSFPGIDAQGMLMALDLAGVACSAGSACSSGSTEPSPVLRAMNCPPEILHSAIRFSLGALTTEAEIDAAAEQIIAVVERLRLVAGDDPFFDPT